MTPKIEQPLVTIMLYIPLNCHLLWRLEQHTDFSCKLFLSFLVQCILPECILRKYDREGLNLKHTCFFWKMHFLLNMCIFRSQTYNYIRNNFCISHLAIIYWKSMELWNFTLKNEQVILFTDMIIECSKVFYTYISI